MITGSPPHTPRRRAVSAAVVAVALLASACGADESTPPTPTSPAEPSIDVHRAPDISSWSTVGSIAVPLGTVDGPTSISGAPFTGYSHTPQGAALAAMDQSVQLATAEDSRWADILPAVTAAGPGRDLWAGNRALISTSGTDPAVTPSIVGYTFEQYTSEAADVSIVQRFSDGSLAATSTPVTWTGDDWKLALPVRDANPVQALTELPAAVVDLDGTRP